MTRIDCVISDLDETLLTSDKTIHESSQAAIKQLLKDGKDFVIATGRGYNTIQDTQKQLGLHDKAHTYSITFNGGMITENKGNTILKQYNLDHDVAMSVLEHGIQHDVCFHVSTLNHTYIYRAKEPELTHLKFYPGVILMDSLDFSVFVDEPIFKVIYQNMDVPYLHKIQAQLPEAITAHCELSTSSNRYLEFNPLGVSKATAILWLCEHMNIDPQHCLAMGDNNNDLKMLQAVGYSATLANGVEAVKAAVDYISPYSHNEEAIIDILNHFHLFD